MKNTTRSIILPNIISSTTADSVIQSLCEKERIGPDDTFAFSAILTDNKLKVTIIEEYPHFSPQQLITTLYNASSKSNARYVQPPLSVIIKAFKPFFFDITNKAYPYYKNLVTDKEDLLAQLYLSTTILYDKGYYLHKHLIQRTFMNDMNKSIRKLKHLNTTSLDQSIGTDDEGKDLTLRDIIPDQDTSYQSYAQFHYTDDDWWEDMFNQIKATMLKEMSELSFDRILIQLKTKTIDQKTANTLARYRDMFNPGFSPRPNRRNK